MSLSVNNSLINKSIARTSVSSSTTTKAVSSSTTSTSASSTVKTVSNKATVSTSCSTTITSGKSASNSTVSYKKSYSTSNVCASSTSSTSFNKYKSTLVSGSLHTEKGKELIDKDNVLKSIYDSFSLEDRFKSGLEELIGKKVLMAGTYNVGEYTFSVPGVDVRYFCDVTVSEKSSGSELIGVEKDITNNIKDINSFVNDGGESLADNKYIVDLGDNCQYVYDGNNEQHVIMKSDDGRIVDLNMSKLEESVFDITISKEDKISDSITTNTGIQYIVDFNEKKVEDAVIALVPVTTEQSDYVTEEMPSFFETFSWEEAAQDGLKAAKFVLPVAIGAIMGTIAAPMIGAKAGLGVLCAI